MEFVHISECTEQAFRSGMNFQCEIVELRDSENGVLIKHYRFPIIFQF